MNKKTFENVRFCPKGDIEANWNKAVGFIPLDKEIIIYKPDEAHPVARFKIGDGKTVVQDLPFADTDMAAIEKLIDEKGKLLIEYVDNAVSGLATEKYVNEAIAAINIKNGSDLESLQQVTAIARGKESIALGNSVARAKLSLAANENTEAVGWGSATFGGFTKTKSSYQFACGYNNIGKTDTLLEVGNGGTKWTQVQTKPSYEQVIKELKYYRILSDNQGYAKITSYNHSKADYDAIPITDIYIFNGPGSNAFEVYENGLVAVGNKVQQLPDGVAGGIDFTGKNPNATALDPTLTGIISYGATGDFASAFGGKSAAIGKRSHAEGTTTIAKGKYSHVEGDNSVALGNDSHAEGYATVSKGTASHAQNYGTQAIGHSSHAGGLNTIAQGDYSTSIGHTTVAFGPSSFAGGYESQANGETSLAYGNKAITEKNYSVAIGNNIIAKHANVTVLGHFNDPLTEIDEYNPPLLIVGNGQSDTNRTNALIILKDGSTAIGGDTYIDGKLTVVEAPTEPEHVVRYADIMHNLCDDRENATVRGQGSSANTYNSFAFGQGAIAGDPIVGMGHCIAMGNQTKAIGYSSAAIGYKTIASITGQLATGSCNRRNDTAYFIVGNGTADAPSNAFEVYADGDVGIYKDGKIYSLHKMLASYFTDANLK